MQEIIIQLSEVQVRLISYMGGITGSAVGVSTASTVKLNAIMEIMPGHSLGDCVWIALSAIIGTTIAFWVGKLWGLIFKKLTKQKDGTIRK